jgi:hypothetical protein
MNPLLVEDVAVELLEVELAELELAEVELAEVALADALLAVPLPPMPELVEELADVVVVDDEATAPPVPLEVDDADEAEALLALEALVVDELAVDVLEALALACAFVPPAPPDPS